MSIGSRSAYIHNRSAARYRPARPDEVFLDFDLIGGSHWRIVLSEISESGVSFAIDEHPAWLSAGAIVEQAFLSSGDLKSAGRVQIVYATSTFASGTSCGAEFFPATEADQRSLSLLIARLDELGLRSG